MWRFKRIVGLVVLVLSVCGPALAEDGVTVGRFYSELGKARHLGSVDAASVEASLRSAGFDLPKIGLDSRLNEEALRLILNSLGVNVTTSRPSSPVTGAQVDQIISAFGSQMGGTARKLSGAAGGSMTPNDVVGDPGNSGNGKGNKKGHNKSSSEPI